MAKQDVRRIRSLLTSKQSAEVGVARHHHPSVSGGMLEDHKIGCVGEADVEHVDRIVSCLAQDRRDAR